MSDDLFYTQLLAFVKQVEQKHSVLLSSLPFLFNEMRNAEATGNLDVTFLDATMLSLRFGPCKHVANIKSSCIARLLRCCCFMKLVRKK